MACRVQISRRVLIRHALFSTVVATFMHGWTHQQPCWRRTVQTEGGSIKPGGWWLSREYTVNLILTEEWKLNHFGVPKIN